MTKIDKSRITNGLMDVSTCSSGTVIWGKFTSPEVQSFLLELGPVDLTVCDPPYGQIVKDHWDQSKDLVNELLESLCLIADLQEPNTAAYVFGGTGTYRNRVFYSLMSLIEFETPWTIANHITWSKRRAYGVRHNYLYTREELAYLTLGEPTDIKRFNVPYLDAKRGYAGFNKKYPAKSEFFRRTNVWADITEMFKGKKHVAQKPVDLIKVPIEVHTAEGDTVFDPYCGSGTTAVAAKQLRRRFIVIDSDKESFELTLERLKKET